MRGVTVKLQDFLFDFAIPCNRRGKWVSYFAAEGPLSHISIRPQKNCVWVFRFDFPLPAAARTLNECGRGREVASLAFSVAVRTWPRVPCCPISTSAIVRKHVRNETPNSSEGKLTSHETSFTSKVPPQQKRDGWTPS